MIALLYARTHAVHLRGLDSRLGGKGASPAVLQCKAAQQELAQTPLAKLTEFMHSMFLVHYSFKERTSGWTLTTRASSCK